MAIQLFLLCLFAVLGATPASAFRLDPMVANVSVSGTRASATYSVENTTNAKVALQFEVRRRVIDENGVEERPAASGFQVYPEQMQLDPGQKRSVRVTWQGDKAPEKELPFRFVASQLPVEFAEGETKQARNVSLKFLIEYVASLYLNPPRTKAKPRFVKHQVDAKKNQLELLVDNEGSAHFLLDRLSVKAKAAGKKDFSPGDEELKEIRTENLLPGDRRWLRLQLPKDFPRDGLDVSVEFGT